MRHISDTTLSNQNISSALLVLTYTADADRGIFFRVFCDQVAGNGAYTCHATVQLLGAGSAYVELPKSMVIAAAGETAIGFTTRVIPVKNTDVVRVYVLGLAGDTTTPDIVTEVWEDLSAQDVSREVHGTSGTVRHVAYNAAETMGNDALSWATADLTAGAGVKTDVEAATAGDAVHIGAGTFAIGNNRTSVPTGVKVQGAGIDLTTLTSTKAGGLSAWLPASQTELSDCTLDTSATAAAIAFGIVSIVDAAASKVVLRRVKIVADYDALYVNNLSACTLDAYDCIFSGKYDSVVSFSGNHVLNLYNCTINTLGPTASGPTAPSDGVVCSQGTIWLWNCNVNCQDGNAGYATDGLYAYGAGNIVMVGGRIRTYNAAGTDLAVVNTGSGKIILIGVDYDRTKTSNTGTGSIVDIPSHSVDQDGATIEAAAQAALVADNLDHLLKTAVASNTDLTTEVTDNTIMAHLLAGGDTSTFAPATMSIKQIAADAATVVAKLVGITLLAKWLRGLYRKDAMDATAKSEVNTGGGTFDETTDSNEGIRDTVPTAVWAAATRTLTGSSGARAPDALTQDEDVYMTAPKNGTCRLCKRVYLDGDNILQADISTITYSIFLLDDDVIDTRTAVTGHSAVSLTVVDVIFDTLQTDSQASNYNFRHTPPIATTPIFTIAGRNYLVEYTITPTSGQKIVTRFKVNVT